MGKENRMKLLYTLLITLLFFGCEFKTKHNYPENKTEQMWEDIYSLYDQAGTYAGELYVSEDVNGDLTLEFEKLLTRNPNESYGFFPAISFRKVSEVEDGLVFESRNVNYSSNDDLEHNASGSNITGNKFTTFQYTLTNDKLVLEVTIFENASGSSGSINDVLTTFKYETK